MIQNGQTIGFSAFTSAGAAQAVPVALAERAKAEHAAGRPFKVGVLAPAAPPNAPQIVPSSSEK